VRQRFIFGVIFSESMRGSILRPVAILLIIFGILSTFSRSAYIGLAVLGLIWGFYHYRLLLTGIILLIIIFALLGNLFPNLVYQQWYRFQVDTVSKWSAENRLEITQKSLNLISQKPFLGYGIENFSTAFPTVVSSDDLGLKDIVVDSSHNLFLDLAVQTGLIGLGLFLAVLVLTFSVIPHLIKRPTERDPYNTDKPFVQTAASVIIAFLIVHQFSPVSVVPMVFFWISMGIITPTSITAIPDLIREKQSSTYIIHFIGISLIVLTAFFIIQTLRADNLFRESSAYEVSDIQKSIKLDNEAINLAPWIDFYKIRRNFLYRQLGY